MRNVLIIVLWALLLAAGITGYYFYRQSVQAESALDARTSELAALQAEAQALRQERSDATAAITALKAASQQFESRLEASRQEAAESADRFRDLKTEIEQLKATLDAKTREIETVEEAYSRQSALAEQAIAEKNRLIADRQREQQGLSREVQEAAGAIDRLRQSEKSLQSQLAAEKQARLEDAATIERLQSALTEVQARLADEEKTRIDLEARHRAATDELAAVRLKLGSLEEQLAERNAALAGLRGEKEAVLKQADRIKSTYEALVSGLREDIDQKQAQIEAFEDSVRVRFADRVLFESGRSTVTAEGKSKLGKLAEALRDMPGNLIRVSGHTDNVPIAADYRYKYPTNWELSAARAAAVARYFIDQLGWDGSRLQATGFSAYRPVADNATAEGRAQNRRVEIEIVPAK